MSSTKKPTSARRPAAGKATGRFVVGDPGRSAQSVVAKPGQVAVFSKPKARVGMTVAPPKPMKVITTKRFQVSFGVSTGPLVAAVRNRLPTLSPDVARSLQEDFRKLLDAQMLKPLSVAVAMPGAEVTDPILTTQEAAELVGVSRPFLAARIDAGEIELHHMAGNQRRVLRSAVLAWQKQFRQGQLRALGRLGAALDDEIFSD